MVKGVFSCSPGTSAGAAAETMRARNCDVLLVLDDNGRVACVVTDHDLSAI
jgi:CBS domain-containing protein